jgi:cobalt/nickel transport system permease protein
MINFTIPGTGSSGHIGGGILLAALLGPFPALIVLASVLLIQCLLFADGGLLAYGCNVFNMGICACLLAYQCVYKPIIGKSIDTKHIFSASVASVILGLQVGAFGVVLETYLSGVTALPFGAFLLLMQPIHLAIGLVEGIVTAVVLAFIYNARPELLTSTVQETKLLGNISTKKVVAALLVLTVLVGGGLSLFASAYPDGLEWSMEGVAGTAELERDDPVHKAMSDVIETTAFMPDYSFAGNEEGSSLGTATAGIVGSSITLALAGGLGFAVSAMRKK